jgi:hypothetical protein
MITSQRKRDYQAQYYKNWYALNGRKRSSNYQEVINKWKENNLEKYRAKLQVRYAIQRKELIKPMECSKCNRKVRLFGHHFDYSKPLEVVWLCGSCHKNIHLLDNK